VEGEVERRQRRWWRWYKKKRDGSGHCPSHAYKPTVDPVIVRLLILLFARSADMSVANLPLCVRVARPHLAMDTVSLK